MQPVQAMNPANSSTLLRVFSHILLPVFVMLATSSCSTSPTKVKATATPVVAEQQAGNGVDWHPLPNEQANTYLLECKAAYDSAKQQLSQLESAKEFAENLVKADPKPLLHAINQLDITLDTANGKSGLYFNVHPTAEVRQAAELCQTNLTKLLTDYSLSLPLYTRLAAVNTEHFDAVDKRFVVKMLQSFKRGGVALPAAEQKKIRELSDAITQLGIAFSNNMKNDSHKVVVKDRQVLAGLPADFIAKLKPNDRGEYELSTDYPIYFPIMQYAKNDQLRKDMYIAFRQRGYPANEQVLKDLLSRRYELAKLLGYDNYAQFATDDMMIKKPENAQVFIDKINQAALPRANRDYQELLSRLRKIDPTATSVGDWQKTYLEDLVKTDNYHVDSQKVREYFSYGNVEKGIFDLTEHQFGVQIKPWVTDVWHPSVKAFEIWDKGKIIGRFYLDMHPREGKYGHAAKFSVHAGITGVQLPVAALICNFPGENNPAALMQHDEVETYLHEFGHLLHHIFAGQQRWVAQSGTATETDFVEAPSQMLEEWVWDADTLKTFARNAKGQVIPDALIKKLGKSRNFGKGLWTRHQMFYASMALDFYNRDPANIDLTGLMKASQAKYSPFPYVDNTYFYTSFGHLDGYSALYYSYMWSLVIAADMFSEFERDGLRNPNTAQHYRETVLAPGGSKDAAEFVRDFLGRPYNFDAFARQLNRR